MKIYVINMARSVNRRLSMEEQLKKLNIEHEFVLAVDGRELPDQNAEESKYGQSPLTKSEIGCMMSHRKVYARMQECDDPLALVLEDDIHIHEHNLANLLDGFFHEFSKETVTLLTYFGRRDEKVVLKKIKNLGMVPGSGVKYHLCQPEFSHSLARAGAYVISKECAKKFLDYHTPNIQCRADEWEAYFDNNIMPIEHCLYPMPIAENYEHGSEINYTRNGIESLGKKFITWSIYKKVPILSYLFMKRRESFSSRYKNIELES